MLLESRTCGLYAEQGFYLSDAASPVEVADFTDMVRTRIAPSTHSLSILLCPAEGDADISLAVAVEVHDGPPPLDRGDWEHIAEASMHVPSGQLLVHSIEENEEFAVSPGWCRVRSYHAPFVRPAGDAPLPHRVEVWPAPQGEVVALREAGERPSNPGQ
jgi:hypothetical protein